MEQMMQAMLNGWRNTHRSSHEDAFDQLSALAQFAAQQIESRELQVLRMMGSLLDTALLGEEINEQENNQQAYNLGKAHAIIELINFFLRPCELQETARTTVGNEEKVLMFIAKHREVTPSEIMNGLDIENKQQISNLLRNLRLKRLVSAIQSGKNRYYSLTTAGREVLGLKEKQVVAETVNPDPDVEKVVVVPMSRAGEMGQLLKWRAGKVSQTLIEQAPYPGLPMRSFEELDSFASHIPTHLLEESLT